MAVNRVPVLKRCRALGLDPAVLGVSKESKRQPVHASRKLSEYGLRLKEKQKAKFIYGILENQCRKAYEKAKKMPGVTGENFLALLERRFDNVVYRLGFASTRRHARQLVRHGHFTVNGEKLDFPSVVLKPGDVIAVAEKSRNIESIKSNAEANRVVPAWLSVNPEQLSGSIVSIPVREQIEVPIEEQLIVEFYAR